MSANLIDVPPGRKSGRLLQDVPLLTKDLVLPPQPLQLGRHVRLCLPPSGQSLAIPAPANPADQRRQPDPKISRDLALAPPNRQRQPDRLVLKSPRKSSPLHH
jgi:hypothetical protein